MWKAGGWWVTRKSFCTVCCRFGTQTGLRKKTVLKIPITTTETCSFYPGRKNKGVCKHQPSTDLNGSMRYTPDDLFGLNSWLVTPLTWHPDVADAWMIQLCSSGYV